ncbi:MAG: hypothetical protein F4150_04990 [Chloroflexi bacterium]|nr:hypothetical protein [Chloroflexota bacterium]
MPGCAARRPVASPRLLAAARRLGEGSPRERRREGGSPVAGIDGAGLLVRSLRAHGVDSLFSVPGDPLGPFLDEAVRAGIENYTIRHEQAIAMAAQAYSYVRRDIGVGAVTSGPAMTNAITGLATAWANCWPMLLLGGSSELGKRGLGDFQ